MTTIVVIKPFDHPNSIKKKWNLTLKPNNIHRYEALWNYRKDIWKKKVGREIEPRENKNDKTTNKSQSFYHISKIFTIMSFVAHPIDR